MASSSKGKGKAKAIGPKETSFYWSYELTKTLVEIILAYHRKAGRDQPKSWGALTAQFQAATGKKCNSYMLKNRNRDMKMLYNAWKSLRHGEMGLGWDAEKGTIKAPNEWWEKKIAENADYKRFRKKGIPPELEDLWEQLYGGTVATGQYCVAPSMEPSQRLSQVPPPISCTAADEDGATDEEVEVDGATDEGATECDPLGSLYAPLESEFDELFGSQGPNLRPASLEEVVRGICEGAPTNRSQSRNPSTTTPSHTQRVKRVSGSGSGSNQGTTKRSLRKSEGSKLYQRHVEMVQDTNNKLLAMLEKDEVSSSILVGSKLKG